MAGQPFKFSLIVNDQCGFRYWKDDLASRMSSQGPRALTWLDFPPTCDIDKHLLDAFDDWRYSSSNPALTSIAYEWRRTSPSCGMGPLVGTITSTVSGWFGLDLLGITSNPVLSYARSSCSPDRFQQNHQSTLQTQLRLLPLASWKHCHSMLGIILATGLCLEAMQLK